MSYWGSSYSMAGSRNEKGDDGDDAEKELVRLYVTKSFANKAIFQLLLDLFHRTGPGTYIVTTGFACLMPQLILCSKFPPAFGVVDIFVYH